MGKRSTFRGYLRSQGLDGGSKRPPNAASIGSLPITVAVTVDPAAADGTPTGEALPLGAIVLGIDVKSGHTGGTTPLLNIGLGFAAGDDVDALVDGAAADADTRTDLGVATIPGANFGVALTETVEILAGTGGGTPGTGTSVAYITYVMDDDGKFND